MQSTQLYVNSYHKDRKVDSWLLAGVKEPIRAQSVKRGKTHTHKPP